ncbi:MAG TPA: (d)CMP kinase [Fusobacteria bacterium]|nr:(d)CMP kinase [Fusobacteriota bacterium]|tara:strand:- start:9068 stop:9655 length:588 start_codon:yes stop_codon:yes gene_type:complete
MVITVDGCAASGKSSLARKLANKLGCEHLDAGMMFRAVALAVIEKLDRVEVEFKDAKVFLNGENVTERVRERDVTNFVSDIGGDPSFRDMVYSLQRDKASKGCVVASGRDTGSAVFPHADYKFFVDADLDVRAFRRYQDFQGNLTLEEVKKGIEERDEKDLHYGSLIKPEDAIEVDNSKDSVEDVVNKMLSYIKS